MKLYQISERYQNVYELLGDADFIDNEDIIAALDNIEDEFKNKVLQTVYIIKNREPEILAIDAEIQRLQAVKKVRKAKIDRLKNHLRYHMGKTGVKKVANEFFQVSYREMENHKLDLDTKVFLANNLDEALLNVEITPNNTAIKEALKQGKEIIGAKLVNSQVLTIR